MKTEEVQDIVREYLKENLTVCVITEKYYGDYGSGEGVKVKVQLFLEGEQICSEYDYTSL